MEKYIMGVILALGLVFGGIESAQAVTLQNDNVFVLDFIADGDGGGEPE